MDIWEKNVRGREKQCKGPEVGTSLGCLGGIEEISVAGGGAWKEMRAGRGWEQVIQSPGVH